MSRRPKLAVVKAPPGSYAMTLAEKHAMNALMIQRNAIEAEMQGIWKETSRRLSLPEDSKITVDLKEGMWRKVEEPAVVAAPVAKAV